MKIFKSDVVFHIVVSGEDENEAREAIDRHTFLDGVPKHLARFAEVKGLNELEHGWQGADLAFTKWSYGINDQSIAYWLKQTKQPNAERIAELEAQIERLRGTVDTLPKYTTSRPGAAFEAA